MFTTKKLESENDSQVQMSDPVSLKTKIIIAIIVISLFWASWLIWEMIKSSKSVTVDNKLEQLKELRSEKSAKRAQIDQLNKEVYLLDQKIIPLKCSVYSEVWAKDTWETECRDEFDAQASKIISATAEKLETDVVPEYQ